MNPTIPRPDVAARFPRYVATGVTPGWQTSIDLGETAGDHTILAQAEDDLGATGELGRLVVTLIGR